MSIGQLLAVNAVAIENMNENILEIKGKTTALSVFFCPSA